MALPYPPSGGPSSRELDGFLNETMNLFGTERRDAIVREKVGPRGQPIWNVDAVSSTVWVRGTLSTLETDVRAIPLAAIHRVILEVAPRREHSVREGGDTVVEPGATLRCGTIDGGEESLAIGGPDETWEFARRLVSAWAQAHNPGS